MKLIKKKGQSHTKYKIAYLRIKFEEEKINERVDNLNWRAKLKRKINFTKEIKEEITQKMRTKFLKKLTN